MRAPAARIYRSELDIIAVKFSCCLIYYSCFYCHEREAGHPARIWPRAEFDKKAVLCGACGTELTILQYLNCQAVCPACRARFNPRCALHHHLYFEIFGAVPLQISIETKDEATRAMGLRFADRQWSKPQPDGLSGETRYWIDDMYMITILQLEAYRATNDPKYVDRAAS